MGTVTLEKIHEDLIGLRKEVEHIRTLIAEDYELADDVVRDIKESRSRPKNDFVAHEEMRKEFS